MVEAKSASPLSALYHNTSLQLTAGLQKTPYTHAQITYTYSLAYVHALIHSTSLTRKSSITNHEVATHLITILLQRLDNFFCMLDIHPAQLVSILIAHIVFFKNHIAWLIFRTEISNVGRSRRKWGIPLPKSTAAIHEGWREELASV